MAGNPPKFRKRKSYFHEPYVTKHPRSTRRVKTAYTHTAPRQRATPQPEDQQKQYRRVTPFQRIAIKTFFFPATTFVVASCYYAYLTENNLTQSLSGIILPAFLVGLFVFFYSLKQEVQAHG